MSREIREGVQRVKREVYKRTGISSTGFRQKNENKSRHIRLYNRRGIIYGV